MPPNETDHLLSTFSTDEDSSSAAFVHNQNNNKKKTRQIWCCGCFSGSRTVDSTTNLGNIWSYAHIAGCLVLILLWMSGLAWQQHRVIYALKSHTTNTNTSYTNTKTTATGPYTIVKEVQEGSNFWNFYNFYQGNDTLGSAGYQTYVNRSYAYQQNLIGTMPSKQDHHNNNNNNNNDPIDHRDVITMRSKATDAGPRESIRIEGKTRFASDVGGLFILDLDHIPVGCGQWPAFWLTDTANWPDHGEIDVVEGVNMQNHVKTALHTRDTCSMYAHVPSYKMTGEWDRATGIPDTFTGIMDFNTSLPADNCDAMAPHQWMNQGCVIESRDDNTIGAGFNKIANGGIYVLQWDPIVTQSIQSFVFLKSLNHTPSNLIDSIKYASYLNMNKSSRKGHPKIAKPNEVYPDPQSWMDGQGNHILPYAYFAVGNTTGCSADHFDHMNVIFNLAFCGNVAGNRFHMDQCGTTNTINDNNNNNNETSANRHPDPITACNDYIKSQPEDLNDAYWAIRGVYIYERSTK